MEHRTFLKDRMTTSLNAGDLEQLLLDIADYFKFDAEKQDHELVKLLLYSAAEHCRAASFDYYASFK